MKTILLAAALLVTTTLAAFADPTGTYAVAGTNIDGEAYEGTVSVTRTGDVFELKYEFSDGTEQEGSAVGDDSFLAYGYGDEEEIGVGLMTGKDGNYEGIWTHLGADKMSTEIWTKQ